jgi:hypothetical protein
VVVNPLDFFPPKKIGTNKTNILDQFAVTIQIEVSYGITPQLSILVSDFPSNSTSKIWTPRLKACRTSDHRGGLHPFHLPSRSVGYTP